MRENTPTINSIEQLERLSAIADAKLGVAEEMQWVVAPLLATVIYRWTGQNWFYTIGAYVIAWLLTGF